MSEQNADGAASTVDKSRFDGLMGQYTRAWQLLTPEQRQQVKAQGSEEPDQGSGAQTDGDDTSDPDDSQQTGPEYEEGKQYTFQGGEFVPVLPPSPLRHNSRDQRAVEQRFGMSVDKSIADLEADLDQVVGKPSRTGWGDITAR